MTVYYRKNRAHWVVDVQIELPDGTVERRRKKSPRNTRRGAEEYERQLRDELLKEWHQKKLGIVQAEVPTVRDFHPEFLNWAESGVSHSMYISYESSMRLYVLPFFADVTLDQISTGQIEKFKVVVKKGTRKPLKPASVNNVLGGLSKMLNLALDFEYIDRIPRIHWMKVEEDEQEYWDFDEAARVLEHVDTEPRIANILRLSMATGMRMGEVCGLQWGDIDFQKGVLHVRRQRTKEGRVTPPKWNSKRRIPMSDLARAALSGQKATTFMRRGKERWVFIDDEGLFQFDRIRDGFLRIVEKAGVKSLTFHGLRHTFASHAVMNGVPIEVVQQWLGHKDISMTVNRYAHLSQHFTDGWIDKMNGAVQGSSGATAAPSTKK